MKHSFLFPTALGAVFLILGGVYVLQQKPVSSVPSVPSAQLEVPTTVAVPGKASSGTPPTSSGSSKYKASVVASHASPTDCWSIVRGGVYNLTPWITQHPGGASAVMSMCGKDATASFEAQHGGQGRPEAELVSFKIGTLSS